MAEVWGHLVAVDHLGEWLGQPRSPQVPDGEQVPDGAELRDGVQLRDGVELVVDHGEGYLCTSQVTELAPGRSLAMTGAFPTSRPRRLRSNSTTIRRSTERSRGRSTEQSWS